MTERDALINAARNRASDILMVYQTFSEKKPVMLLELPSQKIYAYPYLEFKASLSERSQEMLEKEYEDALVHNQMVVFVKDNDGKKMISFPVDAPPN
jgi:hypothetical protein